MSQFDDNLGTEGDTIYSALIAAHEGLSEQQSSDLDARLILMLINELGDAKKIEGILKAARDSLQV